MRRIVLEESLEDEDGGRPREDDEESMPYTASTARPPDSARTATPLMGRRREGT